MKRLGGHVRWRETSCFVAYCAQTIARFPERLRITDIDLAFDIPQNVGSGLCIGVKKFAMPLDGATVIKNIPCQRGAANDSLHQNDLIVRSWRLM
jgi:hypothetical protein